MIVSGRMSLQPKVERLQPEAENLQPEVMSLQPEVERLQPRASYPLRPRRRRWADAERIAERTPADTRRPSDQNQIHKWNPCAPARGFRRLGR